MSTKRKAEEQPGPPKKRAKVEDKKDTPVVAFQKSQMLLRIKELNRELNAARNVQDQYEEEITAFHDRIGVIDRHWSQLNSVLSQELSKLPTVEKQEENTENTENTFSEALANALRGHSPSIMEICIRSNSSRLNKLTQEENNQLEQMGEVTRSALQQIITAIENMKNRNASLNEALRNEEALKEKKLAEENKKLAEELATLKEAHKELQVLYTETQKDVKDQKNFAAGAREKLAAAISERDQLEASLTLTNRKLDKVEMPIPAPAQAPNAPMLPSKLPSASPKVRFKKAARQNSVEQAQNSEENAQLKEKIRELKTIADKRLSEINEYGAQRETLLQEITRLRKDREVFTMDQILRSQPYVTLQNAHYALQEEFRAYQLSFSNKFQMETQARDAAQKDAVAAKQREIEMSKLKDQEVAKFQASLQELTNKIVVIEAKSSEDSKPKEDANRAEQIKTITSQQTQLAKLREECSSLRHKAGENAKKSHEIEEQVQSLTTQLAEKETQISTLSQQFQSLTDNIKDTENQEKAALHEQISVLKKNFEELQQKVGVEGEVDLKERFNTLQQIKNLEEKVAGLTTKLELREKELKEIKESLKSQEEESEAYLTEIEDISKELDETQEQNSRLLVQISDKESNNQQLMRECIDLKSAKNLLKQNIQSLKDELVSAQEVSQKQKQLNDVELQMVNNLQHQISKLQEELQVTSFTLESQQKALSESQTKNKEIQAQLDVAKETIKDLTLSDESVISYNKEALNNRRILEKNAILQKKIDRLRSTSVLEEELRECRAMMTCAVCNERQKNAVIAKCFHVFCKECIMNRVTTRSRKCPGCSKPFSETDVHDIYLNFQ